MKRFDESRLELEKVLKMAQNCMTERGNPEELLKKHTVGKCAILVQDSDFFSASEMCTMQCLYCLAQNVLTLQFSLICVLKVYQCGV